MPDGVHQHDPAEFRPRLGRAQDRQERTETGAGREAPQHVGVGHFADAKRSRSRVRSSQTGRPARAPRAAATAARRDRDEIELVRRGARRIHERIGPAEHLLLGPRRRRQREAAELAGDERHLGRLDLQRMQAIGPPHVAGDRSLHPFAHAGHREAGKIGIMPARSNHPAATERRRGFRVYLRAPLPSDAAAFLAAVKASRRLHGAWVQPPSTPARYRGVRAPLRRAAPRATRLPRRTSASSCAAARTTRSSACSTSAKSSAASSRAPTSATTRFAPHAGAGYMAEGLELVLRVAFRRAEAASRRGQRAAGQHGARSRSCGARASSARGFRGATCGSPDAGAITCGWRCWSRTGAPGAQAASADETGRPRVGRRRARALRAAPRRHRGRRAEDRAGLPAAVLPDPRGMLRARRRATASSTGSRAPSRSISTSTITRARRS